MLQMRVDRKKHISPKEGWGQVGAPLAINYTTVDIALFEKGGMNRASLHFRNRVEAGCALAAHVTLLDGCDAEKRGVHCLD